MADNTLITLSMIAREFLLLTGPGEATACFVYDIKKDLRSLAIRKGRVMVADYGFDNRLLTLSLNDFSRMVLEPLAELWKIGPGSVDDGFFHSFEVQDSATERLL